MCAGVDQKSDIGRGQVTLIVRQVQGDFAWIQHFKLRSPRSLCCVTQVPEIARMRMSGRNSGFEIGRPCSGVPLDARSEFVSSARHSVSLGLTGPFILAYADPVPFAAKFGKRFNAEMWGETILTRVMHSPECQGVRGDCRHSPAGGISSQPGHEGFGTGRVVSRGVRRPSGGWCRCPGVVARRGYAANGG